MVAFGRHGSSKGTFVRASTTRKEAHRTNAILRVESVGVDWTCTECEKERVVSADERATTHTYSTLHIGESEICNCKIVNVKHVKCKCKM